MAVLMQHCRLHTNTDILMLFPINKFYITDIIKLTDTSDYQPILLINIYNQLKTLMMD